MVVVVNCHLHIFVSARNMSNVVEYEFNGLVLQRHAESTISQPFMWLY